MTSRNAEMQVRTKPSLSKPVNEEAFWKHVRAPACLSYIMQTENPKELYDILFHAFMSFQVVMFCES